jgi:lysophospholipase L1-like esterase
MLTAWMAQARSARATPSDVACIGDSITAGVGASTPSKDWVSDLAALLGSGVTVANYGVSGTTMMKVSNSPYWSTGDLAMVEGFVTDAGASSNVAVIIMLGTNDSKDVPDGGVDNWNATAPMRYAADYNAMIDALLALTPKPQVFLALPPPAFANTFSIDGTVIANQINPIIFGIAAQRQLPVIDVHSALAGMSGLFPDGVHPNDMGHTIIATTMKNGLLTPKVPPPPGDGGPTDASAPGDATMDSDTSDAAMESDASPPEDASAMLDATTGSDASGMPPADAGAVVDATADGSAADSGQPGAQAGSSGSSGCSCSTVRRARGVGAAWWSAIATLAALLVRRRRATTPAGHERPFRRTRT